MARKTVVLAGALDTKYEEYAFIRDRLAAALLDTVLVDFGVLGSPGVEAQTSRERVAAAGGASLGTLIERSDRNEAMTAMGSGAAKVVSALHRNGKADAVIVLGGSNAGYVMSQIAEALPFGIPKLLASTIVAGDTRPYVGTSDLIMFYPVVDISGLNSISLPVLSHVADACIGMLSAEPVRIDRRATSIATSMFGVTTACVSAVRNDAESDGHEVHVFHATGTGGKSMESMIRAGLFAAVADITTTELADELLGGVCSAGPTRLTAAAAMGIPQVVSVGALDMVNFGGIHTVPEQFRGRRLHAHNPAVTLMRTSAEECDELGRIMAARLNNSRTFTEVLVPARGFSQISVKGAPFNDPDADRTLIESLERSLGDHVPMTVLDLDINDPRFARHLTQSLHRALRNTEGIES